MPHAIGCGRLHGLFSHPGNTLRSDQDKDHQKPVPTVRPSINILDRRLAVLTGISTGLLTGRLDERFD